MTDKVRSHGASVYNLIRGDSFDDVMGLGDKEEKKCR